MIDDAEATRWAQRFGVDVTQVRRDHLVSHILNALPSIDGLPAMAFIGGTALCRTHLDGLRVSEDVDLLTSDVVESADSLVRALGRRLRREYPDVAVSSPAPVPRGRQLRLIAPDTPPVEVQLIGRQVEDDVLLLEPTPTALRYERLPEFVDLQIPTIETFVAMKYAAFRDRQEPRDLFDLAHLTRAGAFVQTAAGIVAELTGAPPMVTDLRSLPSHTVATWSAQLNHQTQVRMTPEDARRTVEMAVAKLTTVD